MACVRPDLASRADALLTLQFMERARHIRNHFSRNERDPRMGGSVAELRRAREEAAALSAENERQGAALAQLQATHGVQAAELRALREQFREQATQTARASGDFSLQSAEHELTVATLKRAAVDQQQLLREAHVDSERLRGAVAVLERDLGGARSELVVSNAEKDLSEALREESETALDMERGRGDLVDQQLQAMAAADKQLRSELADTQAAGEAAAQRIATLEAAAAEGHAASAAQVEAAAERMASLETAVAEAQAAAAAQGEAAAQHIASLEASTPDQGEIVSEAAVAALKAEHAAELEAAVDEAAKALQRELKKIQAGHKKELKEAQAAADKNDARAKRYKEKAQLATETLAAWIAESEAKEAAGAVIDVPQPSSIAAVDEKENRSTPGPASPVPAATPTPPRRVTRSVTASAKKAKKRRRLAPAAKEGELEVNSTPRRNVKGRMGAVSDLHETAFSSQASR